MGNLGDLEKHILTSLPLDKIRHAKRVQHDLMHLSRKKRAELQGRIAEDGNAYFLGTKPKERDLNRERIVPVEEIDGINTALGSYGFSTELERTRLILAYGKYNVRTLLSYFNERNETPRTSFFIATLDILAREGYNRMDELIKNNANIVAEIGRHYDNNPLQISSGDIKVHSMEEAAPRMRQNAISYLIYKYIYNTPVPLTTAKIEII